MTVKPGSLSNSARQDRPSAHREAIRDAAGGARAVLRTRTACQDQDGHEVSDHRRGEQRLLGPRVQGPLPWYSVRNATLKVAGRLDTRETAEYRWYSSRSS